MQEQYIIIIIQKQNKTKEETCHKKRNTSTALCLRGQRMKP